MVRDLIVQIAGKNSCELRENEPLDHWTGFKTGGPARFFALPDNTEMAISLYNDLSQIDIPVFLLGNGSNTLVKDSGYHGVVISTRKALSKIERVSDKIIKCEAGVMLSKLCEFSALNSLGGLEFAYGIPGTFGGALFMNAGAYDGEMKDVVQSVRILRKGEILELSAEECRFGYRTSALQDGSLILGGTLKLNPSADESRIRARMSELMERRKEKQPLEYPSCGSTFKRPEGYFAAKLIDDCGLRGYRVGGAMVSEKHCGFVINYDHATSEDILTLIDDIRERVRRDTGVMLEPEIRMIG